MVFRALAQRLASLLRIVIVALALVMLVVLTVQVFMRFVVGQALSWSEEVALTCFSWSMLLAMALGVRELVHVRMEVVLEWFPDGMRAVIERLSALLILLFGLFLAWSGYDYVLDSFGTTSAAIAYPMAWLYAAAPACGLFIALFAAEQLFLGPARPHDQTADDAA